MLRYAEDQRAVLPLNERETFADVTFVPLGFRGRASPYQAAVVLRHVELNGANGAVVTACVDLNKKESLKLQVPSAAKTCVSQF